MKPVHLSKRRSLPAALFVWALFSLLAVFIIWSLRDRARLVRDNENERIFNTLFASLRDYDDFSSAIEENPVLREKITGFAVYAADYSLMEQWGNVPPVFDPSLLDKNQTRRSNRYTIPDRRSASVLFVVHNERHEDRASPSGTPAETEGRAFPAENQRPRPPRQNLWFNALGRGNYIYIRIHHPAYWRTDTITGILYPLSILALLAFVLYIRLLYLRNIEYRDRIEAQQNLVVLGTAASTLAHEIKNPLHSIKLQTGILKKILDPSRTESGTEEIARIEEEVERLTNLTYRVNDYLRDAAGNPASLDLCDLISETSRRLCGSSILKDAERGCMISMDRERACSVFENILRNALEAAPAKQSSDSAGSTEIEASIHREGNFFVVTVNDRGRGIPEGDLEKVFDPFFTSKSTGTGIGLAISRRFVEAAGGTISLENRRDGGISVKVRLPCVS
jgi:two-component system sensor histidine kinase HydH